MLELITVVYRNDHSALLACATLSRSLKPASERPDFALLYRNRSGGFSLVESVELTTEGDHRDESWSFWKSLANLLVSASHPEAPDLDQAIANRLSSIGIGLEFRDSFIHGVPPDGAAILMLVTSIGLREKALATLRSFGGRVRQVQLVENGEKAFSKSREFL